MSRREAQAALQSELLAASAALSSAWYLPEKAQLQLVMPLLHAMGTTHVSCVSCTVGNKQQER